MTPSTTAAIAALNSRSATEAARPARYALELRRDQSAAAVETAALALLAEFRPRIAPLSPADHAVLVLELLTKTLHGTPPPAAFAAGYALADEFRLRTAEPDLPTPFFPEVDPPPPPGTPTEAAIGFPPLCFVDPENLPPRWALERLRVPEAWAFSTAQGRPSRGQGTVIAQPDTGVTRHTELDGVVSVGGWDVLDDDADPTDPLTGSNPGHGTGTASVVVSPETLEIAGSAPSASHMPIRAITSVVQVAQVTVAEAIGHAVDHGAHVITMSLGGLPAAALQHAMARAVAADVIVLAAAGNCVRTVVWPARYDECVAVAATNAADQAWRGTCRGPAVDISAPGQNVFKANVGGDDTAVGQGQGTSFAVALTAGVAALWLAHHGRADLIAAAHARGDTLQAMFLRLLRATARRPAGWDAAEMGAGIADARALLAAGFDAGRSSKAAAGPGFSVASLIAETIGPAAADDPDLDWVRFGPELATTMLQIQLARPQGAGEAAVPPAVSRQLAGSVANPRLREHLGLDADRAG
ncbi:MAG TPA: S8 family serine peptidase [Aldersonia sp.]